MLLWQLSILLRIAAVVLAARALLTAQISAPRQAVIPVAITIGTISLAIGSWMIRGELYEYGVGYGIYRRAESDGAVQRVETWLEKRSPIKIEEIEDPEWKSLNDTVPGTDYRIRVGDTTTDSVYLYVTHNYGGGFLWFGMEIHPKGRKPYDNGTYHYVCWREGVYSWVN